MSVRKVRTPEGSRYYGLPIGSPITADVIARAKASGRTMGKMGVDAPGAKPSGAKPSAKTAPLAPKLQARVDAKTASSPKKKPSAAPLSPELQARVDAKRAEAKKSTLHKSPDSATVTPAETRLSKEGKSNASATTGSKFASAASKPSSSSSASQPGGSGGVPGGVGRDGGAVAGREDSGGDSAGVVLADGTKVKTLAKLKDTPRITALREQGKAAPDLFELDPSEVEVFRSQMLALKALGGHSAAVNVYDSADYAEMRMFLTADGTAGMALHGDEIVSGFVMPGSPNKGAARSMLSRMTDLGGKRLDAFDTVLPGLYAKEGFVPVARVPWNDEYAPVDWSYDTFSMFNGGRPDVVFMAYDPASVDQDYVPGAGAQVAEYDDGLAATKAFKPEAKKAPAVAKKATSKESENWSSQGAAATGGPAHPAKKDTRFDAEKPAAKASPLAPAQQAKVDAFREDVKKRREPATDHVDDQGHFITGSAERSDTSMGHTIGEPDEGDTEAMMFADSFASAHMTADGHLTPERVALHDKIINQFLQGLTRQERPTQFMNGGGPASGKGSMTKGKNKELTGYPPATTYDDKMGQPEPLEGGGLPQALLIDPDVMKMQLPEVQEILARQHSGKGTKEDMAWAGRAHAESSYLAARMHRAALERGYHVIYDGTGDSSARSVKKKVKAARDMGYRVEGNYLSLEPREGIQRAKQRAERTFREVPENVIRSTYQHLPGIFQELMDDPTIFDSLRLFDNNVGYGLPANLVGENTGSGWITHDEAALNSFLGSANRATIHGDLANSILERNQKVEPEITARLEAVADGTTVTLVNPKNRKMSRAALETRIQSIATAKKMSQADAAASITDALSYTLSVDPKEYQNFVQSTLDSYRSQGFTVQTTNAWTPGSSSVGINAVLTTPTGEHFEVQFHTPMTLEIQARNRKLQEQLWALDPLTQSSEIASLHQKMMANSATAVQPAEAESVA